MYKNYIFDLYGTLVDIKTDEESKLLWNKLSLFYSYKKAKYNSTELQNKYIDLVERKINLDNSNDYSDFPIEDIFEKLYLFKNVYPSKDLIYDTAHFFRVLSIDKLQLYSGVIDLLEALKKENKNIYLLSNAQNIFTLYEMTSLGIEHYFDGILFSSDFKICKPNKEFFKGLINKYSLDINDTIMIGNDYFCDILPANELNIDTLYIHSNLSPDLNEDIKSTYKILDGDFLKVKSLVL
jgi:putative hydrolase of the HAD superfamily